MTPRVDARAYRHLALTFSLLTPAHFPSNSNFPVSVPIKISSMPNNTDQIIERIERYGAASVAYATGVLTAL